MEFVVKLSQICEEQNITDKQHHVLSCAKELIIQKFFFREN